MTEERFDAIVVGAGPSGNAAAYTMAKNGLNVLQLERGEYPGSKNVQGAILYADALERLIPDFREDAPLERHVIEQRIWMMDDHSHTGMHYRSELFNEDKPNRYTIIRAQFDRWFSRRVREAGATLLCETTVTDLLRDNQNRVIGVKTDRHGGALLADVVILAEGVNGLTGQQAGLREQPKPAGRRFGRQGDALPAAGVDRKPVRPTRRRRRCHRSHGHHHTGHDRHRVSLYQS